MLADAEIYLETKREREGGKREGGKREGVREKERDTHVSSCTAAVGL